MPTRRQLHGSWWTQRISPGSGGRGRQIFHEVVAYVAVLVWLASKTLGVREGHAMSLLDDTPWLLPSPGFS